jgi:acetoin utilization deacetylase AcuC-like enzyme
MTYIYYSYDPALCVDIYNFPSLSKARLLHDRFQKWECELIPPVELTKHDLYKIHAKHYVDGLYAGTETNGFGNKDQDILRSAFTAVRCHTAAALFAFRHGVATWSLTSGAHHACYDHGGGFCTFNALIYAAKAVQDEYPGTNVLILDGDAHYGNGCVDIIRKLGLEGIDYYRGRKESEILANKIRWERYDLILWNAGADAHKDDCGDVSDSEWWGRDATVRDAALAHNIPLCVSLAGGYVDIEQVEQLHRFSVCQILSIPFPHSGKSPLPIEDRIARIDKRLASVGESAIVDKVINDAVADEGGGAVG